jgi:hypothetical protein
VLHACWTAGALALWGERNPQTDGGSASKPAPGAHPFAADHEALDRAIAHLSRSTSTAGVAHERALLRVRLPVTRGVPMPSPALAHATGHLAHEDGVAHAASGLEEWTVPCVRLSATAAPRILDGVEDAYEAHAEGVESDPLTPVVGESARFYAAASRLARSMLAQQRVVPVIEPAMSAAGATGLRAAWRPWLGDESAATRVGALVRAMPPSARAAVDSFDHRSRPIVEEFLGALTDAWARTALSRENMAEAIDGWDPDADPHVAWLTGLLDGEPAVRVADARRNPMLKTVRRWISVLEDRGTGSEWRLCLRLNEPVALGQLGDLEAPGDDIVWTLSFHLQSADAPGVLIDAEDVWALRGESASVQGRRVDAPQDLLLKELGRAARLYRRLERALSDSNPEALDLNTTQAYEFLREFRPLLAEQGVGVIVPEWWDSPAARVGARLRLDAPSMDEAARAGSTAPGGAGQAMLGLAALVGYKWQIAVGDTPLSLEEFQKLAAKRAPLVRIDGRWVEVRPQDVQAAVNFIRQNPGGEMRVGDALRMAYRSDPSQTGVPILGIDATGWIAEFLEGTNSAKAIEMLETPHDFHGSLRPYQTRGLSWLAFLDRLGLGPCLADDMGLGKTVQMLALMVHERERAAAERAAGRPAENVGPTLLVVPMSIVSNWKREAERFSPSLRVMVHHGVDRLTGETFFHKAIASDLVITTYSLVHRDRAWVSLVPWHRVVLDEAQNIKNPAAKQSQAVRELEAPRRVVLTGTPLENRLAELWSIMDFCNPGLMGTLNDFRRHFAVPIERHHDKERSSKLRGLVRPFILRRLKTDPSVISDLPSKVETKEYCRLTSEQATLYESCVKDMLSQVDKAEGIRRRGLVLTALIRLKQVCNHPAQLPSDDAPDVNAAPDFARSGKCVRLMELLDEVIASGAQALVFTQFRQMGVLLASMLRARFDREILLLHGGTPHGQRQNIIDTFQKGGPTAPPVLVLSLKAGGVGLNLTAASHVFHFDRWWNPAVENQATDRAFRIGQTRSVNVHKFVVTGSLEERIDQMIESKIALAEDVIGSGEDWLTELSTSQLRDILTLRPEAVGDE